EQVVGALGHRDVVPHGLQDGARGAVGLDGIKPVEAALDVVGQDLERADVEELRQLLDHVEFDAQRHRCIPHLRTVRASMVRNTTLPATRRMMSTVKRRAKTLAISSSLRFWKMYQPRPPEPELTPNTSSAAMSVRQAKAQPILSPVRIEGKAAGIRIR